MKPISQNEKIIAYLKKPGRFLTPMKALKLFNCWSLSSRISNIRSTGVWIKSELIFDKKSGKHFSKYFMP